MASTANKRKPGRPRNQNADKIILDTTLELLASTGYAGLTLEQVARKANSSKSTIYRRWDTKQQLVIAAFSTAPILECLDRNDLKLELFDLMEQFTHVLQSTPIGGVLLTLMAEKEDDPKLSGSLDPLIKARRQPFKDVLRRSISRKELPADMELELAVDMIMGPIVVRAMFSTRSLSTSTLNNILDMSLTGLGAKL